MASVCPAHCLPHARPEQGLAEWLRTWGPRRSLGWMKATQQTPLGLIPPFLQVGADPWSGGQGRFGVDFQHSPGEVALFLPAHQARCGVSAREPGAAEDQVLCSGR